MKLNLVLLHVQHKARKLPLLTKLESFSIVFPTHYCPQLLLSQTVDEARKPPEWKQRVKQ